MEFGGEDINKQEILVPTGCEYRLLREHAPLWDDFLKEELAPIWRVLIGDHGAAREKSVPGMRTPFISSRE